MPFRRYTKPKSDRDGEAEAPPAGDESPEDEGRRALAAALRYLGARARTISEVRGYLARRGFSEAAVEWANARLADYGYVDDKAFAEAYVRERDSGAARSSRALTHELRRHGVDQDTAEVAAAATDDLTRALAAGRTHLRALNAADGKTFREKMAAFLARRGFDWETSREAVRALWAEEAGVREEEGDGGLLT